MAELIKIILAKPEWQTKMNDAEIVEKWQAEIFAQGISEHVFKCTLDLLKSYDKISKLEYDDDDDDAFKWCVRLGVSMRELGWKCDCDCSVCVDGHNEGDTEEEEDDEDEEEGEGEGGGGVEKVDNENKVKEEGDDDIEKVVGEKVAKNDGEEDDDDDDEDDDDNNDEKGDEKEETEEGKVVRPVTDWAAEYRKRKRNPCKCTVENRIILFQKFVDQFVSCRTFQDMALKRTFLSQISALERSVTTVDYHPGSDNLVIDLVHPSLFCYVKGLTVVGAAVSTITGHTDTTATATAAPSPSLLPPTTSSTTPLSPPLSSTSPSLSSPPPIPSTDAVFQWLPSEFRIDDSEGEIKVSVESYINNLPYVTNGPMYDSISKIFGMMVPQFNQLLEVLHTSDRLVSPSTVPFKLSQCQVIVKLASVVIPPVNTGARTGSGGGVFPGGHWHLEGMETERIVATGIYYYEMSNIQSNSLKFRSTVGDLYGIEYPQGGYDAVQLHYGMKEVEDGERYDSRYESTLDLGEVDTVEDLMLVFPNFLQHRVSDFKLSDPTQEGRRKILCFFLINPYEKVISTAHVPPQQDDMTLEDAKLFRELLMFQRKYQIDDQTRFFERGWSLCEH